MSEEEDFVQCTRCGDDYPLRRRSLGFLTCVQCGEEEAREVKHLIIPVHKSNDMVITAASRDLLKGAGCKGGQVLGGGSGDTDAEPTSETKRSYPKDARSDAGDRTQTVRNSEQEEFTPHHRRITLDMQGSGKAPTRDPWFKRSGYKR